MQHGFGSSAPVGRKSCSNVLVPKIGVRRTERRTAVERTRRKQCGDGVAESRVKSLVVVPALIVCVWIPYLLEWVLKKEWFVHFVLVHFWHVSEGNFL